MHTRTSLGRGPVFALGLSLVLTLLLAASARADHPDVLGEFPSGVELSPGESVFWDGKTVDTGDGPFTYKILLAKGSARFRVALDTPSRSDSFELTVADPGGSKTSITNSNQFNEEVFIEDPEPGLYTVTMDPTNASKAFFRLRAKSEKRVRSPKANKRGELLPNLKVVPPMEFTFTAPANPLNGLYPPDTVNPPLDVGGVHPLSCTADESAPAAIGGYDAVRCLRLTSGPINAGKGPYDMRFTFLDDVLNGEGELEPNEGTIQRAQMFQAIHKTDGSLKLREAGTYSFHLTHAHFHDNNVLTYQLLELKPGKKKNGKPAKRPRLVRASVGTKSGFCPADQLYGEFGKFKQEPSGFFGEGDSPAGSCFDFVDGFLGLTRGWGDVYRWQRPGQYVEFDGMGDGRYVVRAIVDKPDEVKELNEKDNAGYALIKVVGEDIRILERGQGKSPWDPKAKVFEGSGPAAAF